MKTTFKNLSLLAVTLLFCSIAAYSQPTVYENAIDFESEWTATLVGEDGLIMKTTDGGASWVEQTSGVSVILNGNDVFSSTKQVVAGQNGVVLVSNDGGASWEIKTTGTFENLNKVEALSENEFVVCGDNGTILKSNDGGETWNSVTSPVLANLKDVEFLNSQEGYIVGHESTLLQTNDGGESWQQIELGLGTSNFNALAVLNRNTMTIVGDEGLIINTTDNGNSWYSNSGMMFTGNFVDIIYFDGIIPGSKIGIAVGSDGLMARTTDNGSSWTGTNSTSGEDIMAANFAAFDRGISVGENGVELYSDDGGVTWRDNPSVAAPLIDLGSGESRIIELIKIENVKIITATDNSLKNFPNPFNPATMIHFKLPYDANVSVKIYDIAGREVTTLVSDFRKSGNYSIEFNGKDLSSGVYIYRLTANGYNGEKLVQINRMVLAK